MRRSRAPGSRPIDAGPPGVAPLATRPGERVEARDVPAVFKLASQLEEMVGRERELRAQLLEVHVQLAERDRLIGRLAGAVHAAASRGRDDPRAALHAARQPSPEDRERWDAERGRLTAALSANAEQLAAVQATRVWRAARLWWRLRERLRVR